MDMNDEQITYELWLKQITNRLEVIRKEGVCLATAVIGQTLYSEDLYVVSIIDKCIRLIDGFINMMEQRNLTCAGILLRFKLITVCAHMLSMWLLTKMKWLIAYWTIRYNSINSSQKMEVV